MLPSLREPKNLLLPHVSFVRLFAINRKGGRLTTFDMGMSIRAYNKTKPAWVPSHKHWLHNLMISEKDVRWCLRFVDPDG